MQEIMSERYAWSGLSDPGYGREAQEDAVLCLDLSADMSLFVVVDGMGSQPSGVQPAYIAIKEIEDIVRRHLAINPELLASEPGVILREAVHSANKVLGAFIAANEERHAGFGASVTACIVHSGNRFCMAHMGNTRLYLLRVSKDGALNFNQISRDHTKAMGMVDTGVISLEQYHVHPDSLVMTSGLGRFPEPEMQMLESRLKPRDFLLMTTDGIHYALRPDSMANIVLETANCHEAAISLVEAAKMEKSPDNMSAIAIYILPEGE